MKKPKISKNKKGVVIYIVLGIITTLLFIIFGLSVLISSQIKIVGEIGKSVIAFHSADTGIERLGEAIFVGYDYYQYPQYGECVSKIEEEIEKRVCSFEKCKPLIEFNSDKCGLPSKCFNDSDCICPKDKCIGYNFYDYPEYGVCSDNKCIDCLAQITVDASECGYHDIYCSSDEECLCPSSKCFGLEPEAVANYPFKTPYEGELPCGAKYQTFILSPKSIKSIGDFKKIQRAIEIKF